ncbi:hypothetical protein GEMRC1_000390 [Eukaryota sp. GEM-RC1]
MSYGSNLSKFVSILSKYPNHEFCPTQKVPEPPMFDIEVSGTLLTEPVKTKMSKQSKFKKISLEAKSVPFFVPKGSKFGDVGYGHKRYQVLLDSLPSFSSATAHSPTCVSEAVSPVHLPRPSPEPSHGDSSDLQTIKYQYSPEFIFSLCHSVSPLPIDVSNYIDSILQSHKDACIRSDSRKTISPVKVTTIPNDIEFLTDKVIVFHGQSYPCHSSFLSSFSPSSDHEVNFPQLESILPDADLFFQILDYCYGQPFQLTLQNLANVLSVGSSLQLSSLVDAIYKIISEGFSKPRFLRMKSKEVLQIIKSSVHRDVLISYKSKSLTISSLVLICSSEYFKNLFCLNFADSNDRKFSYMEQFSDVCESNFEIFFNYLLGETISLAVNNVVDFFQLAVYFQVKNLKQTCNSFVSSFNSTNDILLLLKTISERNLLNMLKDNLTLFGKLNKDLDLPSPFPLPLSFILLLMTKVTNSWLLKSLSVSITNQVFEEDCHTVSQVFDKILVTDKIIEQVYICLLPLFDQNHLCQCLFTWSMKVFQGFKMFRLSLINGFCGVYLKVV